MSTSTAFVEICSICKSGLNSAQLSSLCYKRQRRCRRAICFIKTVELDLLLLEIPTILLIHKHQVEEIFDAELIVHCLVRGRQIIWRQKQPAVKTRYQGKCADSNCQLLSTSSSHDEATNLIGIFSPRTGAPSMISYFAKVSLSLLALLPAPVDSRRLISISMCFNLILTCANQWHPW